MSKHKSFTFPQLSGYSRWYGNELRKLDIYAELNVYHGVLPIETTLRKSQSSIGRLFMEPEVLDLLDEYVVILAEERADEEV